LPAQKSTPWIAVYLPLVTHEHAQLVLAFKLPPAAFGALVEQQKFPATWRIGMSDRKRTIIARGGGSGSESSPACSSRRALPRFQ